MALGKDGEDLCTDNVRNEKVLRTVKEDRNILKTIKKRKDAWVGHILCTNCLLKC